MDVGGRITQGVRRIGMEDDSRVCWSQGGRCGSVRSRVRHNVVSIQSEQCEVTTAMVGGRSVVMSAKYIPEMIIGVA